MSTARHCQTSFVGKRSWDGDSLRGGLDRDHRGTKSEKKYLKLTSLFDNTELA